MPTPRTVRRPAASKPAFKEADVPDDGDADDNTESRPSTRSSSRPARRSAPEETTPRSSRRAAPAAREVDETPEDDEDTPDTRKIARGGWKTFKQQREARSDFPTNFKVEYGEKYVIAFLDDEPFASVAQHWIDEAPKKKSFYCLEDDCPLCDMLADKPRVLAFFNVVEFVEVIQAGETIIEPQVKVWECGTQVAGQLEELAEGSDTGPLTDQYWRVTKSKSGSGKNAKTTYNIIKVKERDLDDDYGIEPLSDEEFADMEKKMFDSSVIRYTSRSELKDLARSVLGKD